MSTLPIRSLVGVVVVAEVEGLSGQENGWLRGRQRQAPAGCLLLFVDVPVPRVRAHFISVISNLESRSFSFSFSFTLIDNSSTRLAVIFCLSKLLSHTMSLAQQQAHLQTLSNQYQKLQADLSEAVEARQRLDAQLGENELVKKVCSSVTHAPALSSHANNLSR